MASTSKNADQIAIARTLLNVPWCEQYERMISGMLYNSLDPALETARFKARAWSHRYNSWFPHDDPSATFETLATHRDAQLKQILGSVGSDCFIEPPFSIDYGCNIRMGDRVYANFNLCILDCGIVTIGARTLFGPNVSIFAATHETEVQSRRDNVEYAREVTIGEDCWIGGHAVILPGVTIGDGVTVGASSVVTRDVPSWSVVMGSPARVVKKVTPMLPYEERQPAETDGL
ncbi:Nodulation protein L [Cyphellophora attinorum]|uniref:Nodulation protein L n=1 Tax=Cyphellophora attinorum TaxID=1664694 RepID=A0A0N1H2J3_9EURO|nr:Nodulation protein L [Phialophora attinorum]KPI34563.1 Nodulation protein L [Phialophora attinorum]